MEGVWLRGKRVDGKERKEEGSGKEDGGRGGKTGSGGRGIGGFGTKGIDGSGGTRTKKDRGGSLLKASIKTSIKISFFEEEQDKQEKIENIKGGAEKENVVASSMKMGAEGVEGEGEQGEGRAEAESGGSGIGDGEEVREGRGSEVEAARGGDKREGAEEAAMKEGQEVEATEKKEAKKSGQENNGNKL